MAKNVMPMTSTSVSPVVKPVSGDNWMPQAVRQLSAIADLPDGWDSHGAARPEIHIVAQGAELLAALHAAEKALPKPCIHPTPSGGVQFQWESDRHYLEIELADVDCAHFYFVDRDDGSESDAEFRLGDPGHAEIRGPLPGKLSAAVSKALRDLFAGNVAGRFAPG